MNLKFQLDAAKAGECRDFRLMDSVVNGTCCVARNNINETDLDNLCAFNLHISEGTSSSLYRKLRYSFPHKITLASRWRARKHVATLSGLKPGRVDRCPGGCCCFVGNYTYLDACPYCEKPRYKSTGAPVKQFQYLPIKGQLQAMMKDRTLAKQLKYRHIYSHTGRDDDVIRDVFDGSIYRGLLEKQVVIDGQTQGYKYFSDPRDIALGISLDGVTYFRRRKHSVWPIILINYNLPPKVRTHRDRVLCYGVIPGTVKNLDSYLIPLHNELNELAKGASTLDPWNEELFWQHVYLILGFGDCPGISKLTQMKGHNGLHPCRWCEIIGIHAEGGNVYYVPLYRPDGSIDPANLPMRSHDRFIQQGMAVLEASTKAAAERLAKDSGIKGVPLLSSLNTLNFPFSFPLDFMHLIFENLIPNLVRHYTGTFKDLDDGIEDYKLSMEVWLEICKAGSASGDTIPSSFGSRMPNIEMERSSMTAEAWGFWLMHLAPILLRNRFSNRRYYDHLLKLVQLIRKCISFELKRSEVHEIRQGFQDWVLEYEE